MPRLYLKDLAKSATAFFMLSLMTFSTALRTWGGADELALWDMDFGSDLHEGHVFPRIVFCCTVLVPEEAFHLGGDGDVTAVVVDGGVRFGGFPSDAAGIDAGADGAAQFAGDDEERAFAVHLARRPGMVEEGLSGEVAVEFVGEFDADVVEDLLDEFVHILLSFTGLFN